MASINLQGDTSGAITISAPSVAGSNTLTLPATTQTLATQNALGVRNLIINGDMRIAQRGTSSSGITATGYYTVDRFDTILNTAGTWTMSQDTDVPSGQGFSNSVKYVCTTADASPAAGDYFQIRTKLEGQNLQHIKKGTASAESLTLSFWIKSNKTGTYTMQMYDSDNGRYICELFTINSANTWEKKTMLLEGDTSGALGNDNGNSLQVSLWFVAGSDFTTGTLQTTWGTSGAAAAGQTVNLADSTSNYINITGVQLEIGDTATPFEHRPYDMELARCQRYFQTMTFAAGYVDVAHAILTTAARGPMFQMSPSMRAAPTITLPTAGTGSGQLHYTNGAGQVPSGVGTNAPQGIQVNSFRIEGDSYSGLNANQPSLLRIGSGGSGTFTMSAEL